MKKLLAFLLMFTLVITPLFGCKPEKGLEVYLSELRSDLFEGKSQTYTIKAGYGFKETPFINDGVVGETVSALNFRLGGTIVDGATYTVSFTSGSETFNKDFSLNPITHSLTAAVEVDNFSAKEFTVSITSSGKTEEVVLKSVLPDQTITPTQALKYLSVNQADLINNYTDENGNLKAELYMRVLVKDDKPFYYLGIATGNDKLKALLVDGISGEVLAIREIF